MQPLADRDMDDVGGYGSVELDGDAGATPDQARNQRRLREGARPKVHSQRDLRRDVFRHSLEARADEKSVAHTGLRAQRPQTRGECAGGQRPCPWASCRYHLYLSVNPESGAITINFPDREPWELKESCALDVAERGGVTLEEVGKITNLTRERVRQMEVRGLLKLKALGAQLSRDS